LIHILDNELRLITPTVPVEDDDLDEAIPSTEKHYQLTHDFLVDSLQEWLSQKQKETRRGRAVLMMEQRYSIWKVKEERRFLPSLAETLSILLHTRRGDRSAHVNKMIELSLHHVVRVFILFLVAAFLTTILFTYIIVRYGSVIGRLLTFPPVTCVIVIVLVHKTIQRFASSRFAHRASRGR
jgi:hypothetical protein